MAYLRQQNSLSFKLLIADGGKGLNLEKILTQTERFPNVDYEYIRYPYDATYAQYYGKTYDALSRVKTPFAAVAQDDDFYFIEGLQGAVDFLSTHEEYIACLVQQVEEFQGNPSTFKNLKICVQNFSPNSCLQKILRRWFHIYQYLMNDSPRPINPSSEVFQNVQPIHDFITSTEETIDG